MSLVNKYLLLLICIILGWGEAFCLPRLVFKNKTLDISAYSPIEEEFKRIEVPFQYKVKGKGTLRITHLEQLQRNAKKVYKEPQDRVVVYDTTTLRKGMFYDLVVSVYPDLDTYCHDIQGARRVYKMVVHTSSGAKDTLTIINQVPQLELHTLSRYNVLKNGPTGEWKELFVNRSPFPMIIDSLILYATHKEVESLRDHLHYERLAKNLYRSNSGSLPIRLMPGDSLPITFLIPTQEMHGAHRLRIKPYIHYVNRRYDYMTKAIEVEVEAMIKPVGGDTLTFIELLPGQPFQRPIRFRNTSTMPIFIDTTFNALCAAWVSKRTTVLLPGDTTTYWVHGLAPLSQGTHWTETIVPFLNFPDAKFPTRLKVQALKNENTPYLVFDRTELDMGNLWVDTSGNRMAAQGRVEFKNRSNKLMTIKAIKVGEANIAITWTQKDLKPGEVDLVEFSIPLIYPRQLSTTLAVEYFLDHCPAYNGIEKIPIKANITLKR